MEFVPVSGALGAQVIDVDLRSLTSDELSEIIDGLHRYEVVFFRGAHLSEDEHMSLANAFGEINLFPVQRLLGFTEPQFQVITDGPDSPPEADDWHTDVTWTETPPKYALLHANIIPERGGDTLWVSTTAAYDALSPTMQRVLDGLEVVHDCESFIEGVRRKAPKEMDVDALVAQLRLEFPAVKHPLVRTNPDTRRRGLFLGGGFMRQIDGMHRQESDAILAFLGRHIEDARFQVRWRWEPGDLAIWDERSTNHRSAGDHFPQHRSIRRIEIAGERPYFEPSMTP
jgi:taurine dioxygenase